MDEDTDGWGLVAAAAAGDTNAFGQLYRQHRAEVYRFVRRRTNRPEVAEDITQEVFLRALRSVDRAQDQGVPAVAWLITIARNLVIDQSRSLRARYEVLVDDVGDGGHSRSAEDCAVATFDRERLIAAVRELPPMQRQSISLRILAGCSLFEAAEYSQRSMASVRAAQHRGLQTLRGVFGIQLTCDRHGDGDPDCRLSAAA